MPVPQPRTVATINGPTLVHPGTIHDSTTRRVYASGQCVALAVALHRATGLPLVAIADEPLLGLGVGTVNAETGIVDTADAGALTASFAHAGVLTGELELLDINGLRPLHEALAQWDHGYTDFKPYDDCSCRPGCICTDCCYPSATHVVAIVTAETLHELWARWDVGVEPDYDLAATMVTPLLQEWSLEHLLSR